MADVFSDYARHVVELGRFASPAEYRTALQSAGRNICAWGDVLFDRIPITPMVRTLHLVEVSVRSLGFDGEVRAAYVSYQATCMGLELCPAEVGPAFCLSCPELALDKVKRLGMEPLAGRYGNPGIFFIERSSLGIWLSAMPQGPDDLLRPDDSYLYVMPQS